MGSKKINKKLPLNTAKLLLSAALWGLRVSLLSPWRAACAAAREATPRWWPRTASWTTAPGPPAWTATRRPTWRPAALGGSGPARLRPRTCSASGPWDPSAQVLQHQTQSLLHNQHNHSSSSNAPWSVQELWFHLSHSFAYKLLDFSSRLIPCFPSEKLKVVGRTVGFVLPGQDFPLAQIETLIMQYHSVPLGTTLELLPKPVWSKVTVLFANKSRQYRLTFLWLKVPRRSGSSAESTGISLAFCIFFRGLNRRWQQLLPGFVATWRELIGWQVNVFDWKLRDGGAIELLFEFIKASPDDLTCGNVLLLLWFFLNFSPVAQMEEWSCGFTPSPPSDSSWYSSSSLYRFCSGMNPTAFLFFTLLCFFFCSYPRTKAPLLPMHILAGSSQNTEGFFLKKNLIELKWIFYLWHF